MLQFLTTEAEAFCERVWAELLRHCHKKSQKCMNSRRDIAYESGKNFAGGDPFLMKHEGTYYIYCTSENDRKLEAANAFDTDKNGQDGFYVYQSNDLSHWEKKGLCLSRQDAIGEKWFWAPEVSYYKGRFYMVYSAEEHLAVAVSDGPTGPFK